jgi:hypothetical protein
MSEIEPILTALAEASGNFLDPAEAAKRAAALCRVDANGNVAPADGRATLTGVLQRIRAENPELVKAVPARGNMVTDPAVIRLMHEDAAERKSTEALRGIFGKGSSAERAAALMRSDPAEYRRLRGLAIAAKIL